MGQTFVGDPKNQQPEREETVRTTPGPGSAGRTEEGRTPRHGNPFKTLTAGVVGRGVLGMDRSGTGTGRTEREGRYLVRDPTVAHGTVRGRPERTRHPLTPGSHSEDVQHPPPPPLSSWVILRWGSRIPDPVEPVRSHGHRLLSPPTRVYDPLKGRDVTLSQILQTLPSLSKGAVGTGS